MKKTILACVIAMAPMMAHADDVFGMWKTQPGENGGYAEVKIAACGDKICGRITKVVETTNVEAVGRNIIKGMKADGGGKYSGGKIWAPDTNKTYKSKMTLKGSSLEVEGCVAFICRGQTWTRIQ